MIAVTLDAPSPKAPSPRTPLIRKEIREEVRGIKKVSRELAADPAKRLKLLQDAGILGNDGKLTKKYR